MQMEMKYWPGLDFEYYPARFPVLELTDLCLGSSTVSRSCQATCLKDSKPTLAKTLAKERNECI